MPVSMLTAEARTELARLRRVSLCSNLPFMSNKYTPGGADGLLGWLARPVLDNDFRPYLFAENLLRRDDFISFE